MTVRYARYSPFFGLLFGGIPMSNENGETNVPEETSGQTIGSDDSPDVATNLLDDPS